MKSILKWKSIVYKYDTKVSMEGREENYEIWPLFYTKYISIEKQILFCGPK